MTLPIRATCRNSAEYRKTKKVRAVQHAWHVRNYVPRPPREPEPDALERAEIEARALKIREEKFLYWCITGRR